MQAKLVPSHRGWRWLSDGWRLFRASPVMWLMLVLSYWMLMTLVSVVPYVGVVAAVILVPGFSIAFMAAARDSSRKRPLTLSLLFAGFRENPRGQLLLGIVYMVLMVLVLASSALVDDGALARWMLNGVRPTEDILQSDGFLFALAIVATTYMPVMMLMWFAPTLVAWQAMPVAKALFFSLFACLMNWRAFTMYGIASAMVLVVVPFITLFLLILVSGGAVRAGAMALLFPLVFSLMPVMFASFYASYRDVFPEGEDSANPPAVPL